MCGLREVRGRVWFERSEGGGVWFEGSEGGGGLKRVRGGGFKGGERVWRGVV